MTTCNKMKYVRCTHCDSKVNINDIDGKKVYKDSCVYECPACGFTLVSKIFEVEND